MYGWIELRFNRNTKKVCLSQRRTCLALIRLLLWLTNRLFSCKLQFGGGAPKDPIKGFYSFWDDALRRPTNTSNVLNSVYISLFYHWLLPNECKCFSGIIFFSFTFFNFLISKNWKKINFSWKLWKFCCNKNEGTSSDSNLKKPMHI